jgi:ABC-2 type transport system ATP-binding protein
VSISPIGIEEGWWRRGAKPSLLSTHIVEDIAQTCQNLAILQKGSTVFQGTVADLVNATHNKVWIVTTQGSKPAGDLTVVSTMNMGSTVQYRVVGEPTSLEHTVSVQPNLEDSYMWLMREKRPAAATTS